MNGISKPARQTTVLAAGAHPDDIEFMMAGTLLRLRDAGAAVWMWNLASGSCGTATHSRDEIVTLRWEEAQASAELAGANILPPLVDDFELLYDAGLVAKVAAGVRRIKPDIMLVPSPQDYMEDHTNTCRLAVSAAFVRGMRNFPTQPARRPVDGEVTVYHAMPHGLRDPLRRRVRPGLFVDTASVHPIKLAALAEHRSQQHWLDASQRMNQYLLTMEAFARELGRRSGRFKLAEGWRRHLHYGFCAAEADPLREALRARCRIDRRYEAGLEAGC
jgi:LmbE family N-acetylglucosaminyl deacetylase